MRLLMLAAVLACSCAQGGAGDKTAGAPVATSPAGRTALATRDTFIRPGESFDLTQPYNVATGLPLAFPTPAAEPDSGVFRLTFFVPVTDNSGTCTSPVADSTNRGEKVYARVYRQRRVHASPTDIYDEVVADSFWVERGTTVNYWRTVPVDTFESNVRLCKATKCGCEVYPPKQIVQPSRPPKPVLVGP